MRFWISPLELSTDGLNLLNETGLQPSTLGKGLPPSQGCLLLYNSPDQVLASSYRSHRHVLTTPEQLLEAYSEVLACSEQTRQPMLAIWRLQQLGPSGLKRWIESGGASWESEDLPKPQAPTIKPLVAAATLALMEACPQLLDSYLDMELKAELFGGNADLHYRQRLREASLQGEILLQELHAHEVRDQLELHEAELNDAREDAELTLLQLHQVQEELEAVFLANQDNQQRLDAKTKELETRSAECDGLRQHLEVREGELNDAREDAELTLLQLHQVQEELEAVFLANQDNQQRLDAKTKELETLSAECDGLRQHLEVREGELNDAREDAELTLLQLHQVQEELEHYFLRSRSGDALAHNQHLQLRRAQELLARLHPPFANLGARPSITPVEVLPEAQSHPQATTLQTEALLSTYAHSLSRARALLQRSLNR